MRIDVDFSKNKTQSEFLNTVLEACEGKNEYRLIMISGSIRSGKTFATLASLTILCALYPNSKWMVYRKDFPSLMDTTIPSMEKILYGLPQWKWHRSPSNFHVEYKNGSKIFFTGENIQQDPELNAILGLEFNGCVLEQAEELSDVLFKKIQSRMGSHYIPRMPKPIMILTSNPTQNWVKDVFYTPWRNHELKAPLFFINALAKDNPFITEDQWKLWDNLDEHTKRQFIEADWTDMRSKDDLWAYAFDRKKHIPTFYDPLIWNGDKNNYLFLSFDFNKNPITCLVVQNYNDTIHILEQIKLPNSDIYRLCDTIKVKYPGYMYIVTGDASGHNASAMVADNMNYYKIIMKELPIGPAQLKIPHTSNPHLKDNQVLVNSMLARANIKIHAENAKALIYDFENVRMNPDGTILKKDRTNASQQADCLDCFRYYINTFHKNFVTLRTID